MPFVVDAGFRGAPSLTGAAHGCRRDADVPPRAKNFMRSGSSAFQAPRFDSYTVASEALERSP